MDCSPPGSSVRGVFQARVLEWVAISFSWGSSWPRDWTWVSHIVGRCFTIWAILIWTSFNVFTEFVTLLLLLLMFCFFSHKACGILAPRPGIKPTPHALEGEVPTTGPPGKSPKSMLNIALGRASQNTEMLSDHGSPLFQIFQWFSFLPYEKLATFPPAFPCGSGSIFTHALCPLALKKPNFHSFSSACPLYASKCSPIIFFLLNTLPWNPFP